MKLAFIMGAFIPLCILTCVAFVVIARTPDKPTAPKMIYPSHTITVGDTLVVTRETKDTIFLDFKL